MTRRRDDSSPKVFPGALGTRERLVTYGVGYGVGIGVPLALGVSFAVGFGEPAFLLVPLPFSIGLLTIFIFRPTGFAVANGEIVVTRLVHSIRVPLGNIRAIALPATRAKGFSIGIFRVEGIYGTFGSYWNRHWGRFHVYITDYTKRVEIRLLNGSRIIVSPDDPSGFVLAIRQAAARSGVSITFEGA